MKNNSKKSDWKTKSMPKSHRVLSLNLLFPEDEIESIKKGLIPWQMEDKWFVYFKDDSLYCHRSWTGFCIYIGKFKIKDGRHILYELLINNKPNQYKAKHDAREIMNFISITKKVKNYSSVSNIISQTVTTESLESLENEFCNYYSEIALELDLHYSALLENHKLQLNGSSITKAIIKRLQTYYETHDQIAKFLNKRTISPAADFFVETVLFYLKLLLEQRKTNLGAKSEVRIKTGKGYIKPDISVWKDDKVVAIIECKTNLGFQRIKWQSNFESRTNTLRKVFPGAKSFLLVLSTVNWPGFDKDDQRVGKEFFALSNTGMRNIGETPLDKVVENKIEKLFSQIIKL